MLTTIFLVVTLMQTLHCQDYPQLDLGDLSDFDANDYMKDVDEIIQDAQDVYQDYLDRMNSDIDNWGSHSGRSHVVSAAVFGLVVAVYYVM